ncbi:MAG: prepilin-type N-terminal cleavage/methylation domain-containing protein, partial [Candidatus Omnitrophica bacterium]|nr:prepilin-type N-terminal cleavage/methylation domain-containing protein [Candidatus Omnitrophota bacterium]
MRITKNKNNNGLRGFTLTELVITVVIISVIAAFAIPSYQKAVLKAYER